MFALLTLAAGAGIASDVDIASDIEETGPAHCRLLLIESEDAEPYASSRTAFVAELERLRCGRDAGPEITRHTIDNQEGLVRRIWRMEEVASYDAVIVQGTIAAGALRDIIGAGGDRPVFFANVTDPVDLDLISAFDEPPPHNFTGVAYPVDIRERLRFVRRLFPDVESIGLVHTTMPQSRAYNRRLREALSDSEFEDLVLHTREVPFVSGEQGMARSVALAREEVAGLDSEVDVFLAPNDQMGVDAGYLRMVAEVASSPLIGVDESNLAGSYGAVAALYPSTEEAGVLLANKIVRYLSGVPFNRILPVQLEGREAINPERAREFGLNER